MAPLSKGCRLLFHHSSRTMDQTHGTARSTMGVSIFRRAVSYNGVGSCPFVAPSHPTVTLETPSKRNRRITRTIYRYNTRYQGRQLTLVDRHLVQHRVGSCEVYVLEKAGAKHSTVGDLALVGVQVSLHVNEHALPWGHVACRVHGTSMRAREPWATHPGSDTKRGSQRVAEQNDSRVKASSEEIAWTRRVKRSSNSVEWKHRAKHSKEIIERRRQVKALSK